MGQYLTLILAALGSSVLSTLVTVLAMRRKTSAEAEKTAREGEARLINALRENQTQLTVQVTTLGTQVALLQRDNADCIMQNAKIKIEMADREERYRRLKLEHEENKTLSLLLQQRVLDLEAQMGMSNRE